MVWIWSFFAGWALGHVLDAYIGYGPPEGPFNGSAGGGGFVDPNCHYMTAGSQYCH